MTVDRSPRWVMLRRGARLLAGAVLLLSGGAAVFHLGQRYDPVRPADIGRLALVDQDNRPRSLDTWRGKVVVLDFVYTGCGDTCPIKTAQLAGVQAELDPALRRRVQFVSVSVDPEHDDPAALRSYAARTGADLDDWSFLTGDLSKIARFAAAFDAAPESGGEIPSHITTIRLLDAAGQVVRRYVGEPLDEPLLAREIAAVSQTQ